MLQAVLRFQHHQTTTPFQPVQPVAMAKPKDEKEAPPFDTLDDDDEEKKDDEDEKKDNQKEQEKEKK